MAHSDNDHQDDDAFLRSILPSTDVPISRDSLKTDILADYDTAQREARLPRNFGFDWRFLLQRAAFAQAGALAGAGALGLAIGANMSATAGFAGPEDEFYALNETVSAYAALEDEEFAPWATE